MFTSVHRSVLFGPSSGEGPREVIDTVFFPRPVTAALAGLAGFSASFSGSADGRPFGRIVVDVGAADFTGNEAQVACRFGLRDWSGEWDDAYSGVVEYVIRAELEDDESVGGEITINGVEYSQSIQFFRSHLDLDADTRQPDNVIPLIAGKPTAIRVYADYNPPSGTIDFFDLYQGELEVESAGQTVVLTELQAWDELGNVPSLVPGRDTAEVPIAKQRAPFFTIPSELSTGMVTIRGRLRVHNEDSGAESSWSPFFERRLRFHAAGELKVFVVGLQIAAGNQPAVRAPTQAEAELLLEKSRSMFPFRALTVSGFDVKEIAAASAEPIRQLLVDMMGDVSDEYYFGLTSADYGGVIAGAEGDAAAGVAWLVDGVATSLADPNVVAHELGHLKALEHVHVSNEPPDYDVLPSYGSYAYGSIGQHGVDTATQVVYEPLFTTDIMSYVSRQWISAHNYSRLLSIGEHIERPPRFAETLFLSATISRDRSLVRHPSFHFPAVVRAPPAGDHAFVAELADECRNPLAWWPLTPSPGPSYRWPKTFSGLGSVPAWGALAPALGRGSAPLRGVHSRSAPARLDLHGLEQRRAPLLGRGTGRTLVPRAVARPRRQLARLATANSEHHGARAGSAVRRASIGPAPRDIGRSYGGSGLHANLATPASRAHDHRRAAPLTRHKRNTGLACHRSRRGRPVRQQRRPPLVRHGRTSDRQGHDAANRDGRLRRGDAHHSRPSRRAGPGAPHMAG